MQKIDLLKLESELKLPDELYKYFGIVKMHLKKLFNFKKNLNEFEYINNKIIDYVFENIYDKIYPQKPSEEDNIIYKKCLLLSNRVNYKCFIEEKNNYLVFYCFLKDIFGYFEKIEKEKSPRKKLFNISLIFASITNAFTFFDKNIPVADDILPILNYVCIEAHPLNILTNCRFISLFLDPENINSNLRELESTYLRIINMSDNQLSHFTEEIFRRLILRTS